MVKGTCKVAGCGRGIRSTGYCENHWYRWNRYGDPLAGQIRGDDAARFWSKVAEGPDPDYAPHLGRCWIWLGGLVPGGYGTFTVRPSRGVKKQGMAHRWAYQYMVGEIPGGLFLDHLCRVRCCVRPDHLDPVTHAENVRRGDAPAATRARHLASRERLKAVA